MSNCLNSEKPITKTKNTPKKNHLGNFLFQEINRRLTGIHLEKNQIFYFIKSIVDALLSKIGINAFDVLDNELSETFNYSLVYKKGQKVLVEFGKVHSTFTKQF
jgi:hypothetical protein